MLVDEAGGGAEHCGSDGKDREALGGHAMEEGQRRGAVFDGELARA